MQMLVRFWLNHHLLDVVQRPKWRVVKGRSRSYVQAVLAGRQRLQLRSMLHVAHPVSTMKSSGAQ